VRNAWRGIAVWAALWLWCVPAAGQEQGAWLVEEHGQWRSHVTRDAHELRFRAGTMVVVDDAAVVLALDRFPGSCEALHPFLYVRIPRVATQSMVMLDDVGFVRVDERPIRLIRFHARLREGESTVFLEVTRVLGAGDLGAELRRGRTVRIKLGTERATYYAAFPLEGFSAAADRTLNLCRMNDRHARELAPPRAPKPRGTADEDYFDE
jgi:hypothetical protein